jgi:hypothetical protein
MPKGAQIQFRPLKLIELCSRCGGWQRGSPNSRAESIVSFHSSRPLTAPSVLSPAPQSGWLLCRFLFYGSWVGTVVLLMKAVAGTSKGRKLVNICLRPATRTGCYAWYIQCSDRCKAPHRSSLATNLQGREPGPVQTPVLRRVTVSRRLPGTNTE